MADVEASTATLVPPAAGADGRIASDFKVQRVGVLGVVAGVDTERFASHSHPYFCGDWQSLHRGLGRDAGENVRVTRRDLEPVGVGGPKDGGSGVRESSTPELGTSSYIDDLIDELGHVRQRFDGVDGVVDGVDVVVSI